MVSTSHSYASHFPPLLFPSLRLICLVTSRVVACLTVRGGQEFHFRHFFSSDFTQFSSSNFLYFLPLFGPPGGRVAHPGRPWLCHCKRPMFVPCLCCCLGTSGNTPAPCFCEFYHVSSCCLRSVCSVSSVLISHVHLAYKTHCDRLINYLFNVYLHFWSAIIFIDLIIPHQISFYNSVFSILLSSLLIPL